MSRMVTKYELSFIYPYFSKTAGHLSFMKSTYSYVGIYLKNSGYFFLYSPKLCRNINCR